MKRISLIALMAAALLFLPACGRDTLDEALAERFRQAIDAGAGSTVDPDALTDFEWDKLWVFDAYAPGEAIEERIGYSWGEAEYAAPLSDGQYLLVFVLDEEVVRHAQVPADLEALVRNQPWRPGDAFIVQDRTDEWGRRQVVVPVDVVSP